MIRPKVRTMLKVGVGMCLMVAVILILTANGVLSAPAGAETDSTDMETDLWMSVGIVFASVFLLCCAIYFVVSSVSCVAKCCRC
ncbi:unnamed protein product [Larinioides sclopetarius]|uniref:Uncharacterized protein n=2 Tax=Larinioides sclopetarius TaxID=280406 RepID=A0AAV2A2N0_9ARAC